VKRVNEKVAIRHEDMLVPLVRVVLLAADGHLSPTIVLKNWHDEHRAIILANYSLMNLKLGRA
jgi:hypothetical protein